MFNSRFEADVRSRLAGKVNWWESGKPDQERNFAGIQDLKELKI
jgi:hypothetical protein